MDLQQRSFSGKFHRPKPVIAEEKSSGTLIFATSWGEPEHADLVVETIKEQLSLSSSPESTRVGPFIPDLTEAGNDLLSAVQFANRLIYSNFNSKEYTAAVEVSLISIQKKVLSWVQLGAPHIFLSSERGFQPLATYPDWTWQMQQESPLITKGLGLEKDCYPICGSCRVQGRETILFLSRASIPGRLYSLENISLNTCSEVLIEDQPTAPFWLGLIGI